MAKSDGFGYISIYKLTELFPKQETYGLVSQMRRSSVSVPSNIAEGRRRGSRKDYRQFLIVAYGSGSELETQIEISKRLNYIKKEELAKIENLLNEVMKMLNKLISVIKS